MSTPDKAPGAVDEQDRSRLLVGRRTMTLTRAMSQTGGLIVNAGYNVNAPYCPQWDKRLRWVLVMVALPFDNDDTLATFSVEAGGEKLTGMLNLYRLNGTDRVHLWAPCPEDWDGSGRIVTEGNLYQATDTTSAALGWAADGSKFLQLHWRGFDREDWSRVIDPGRRCR